MLVDIGFKKTASLVSWQKDASPSALSQQLSHWSCLRFCFSYCLSFWSARDQEHSNSNPVTQTAKVWMWRADAARSGGSDAAGKSSSHTEVLRAYRLAPARLPCCFRAGDFEAGKERTGRERDWKGARGRLETTPENSAGERLSQYPWTGDDGQDKCPVLPHHAHLQHGNQPEWCPRNQFCEPAPSLRASLISGAVSERAAPPASGIFLAQRSWRERGAAGGTRRQGSRSRGFRGARGEPQGRHPGAPRVFLEIVPLPRLTEMRCSGRAESCIQLCVSLCHAGRSVPSSSRRLQETVRLYCQ